MRIGKGWIHFPSLVGGVQYILPRRHRNRHTSTRQAQARSLVRSKGNKQSIYLCTWILTYEPPRLVGISTSRRQPFSSLAPFRKPTCWVAPFPCDTDRSAAGFPRYHHAALNCQEREKITLGPHADTATELRAIPSATPAGLRGWRYSEKQRAGAHAEREQLLIPAALCRGETSEVHQPRRGGGDPIGQLSHGWVRV